MQQSQPTLRSKTIGPVAFGLALMTLTGTALIAAWQGNQPAPTAPEQTATVLKTNKPANPETISFNEHIRPILSDNCFWCHGPDPKTREAELRIDTEEAAKADLGDYAAIVPGDREASELWIRIVDKADPMPPKKSHKKLKPEEIELIGKWIDQGAPYESHWAYTPPKRPELPEVGSAAWSVNPVDRFVLAQLEARGIKPSAQANKRELMRRVTLDLTGLPPTPEQAAAFMADASDNAYEKYVDSLLSQPTYGEHLAVWWLDLVRYADTIGYHSDNPRISWPYRDWVIHSLNDNMPFDQFTIMQIAGDLMQDEPTKDMLVASSYNRLSPSTEEGGAQFKEYQAIYNADRVGNFSDVWLGSSVGCAQCHDHKFDPYTMEDFYAVAAFFGSLNQAPVSTERGYPRYEPPFIFLPQDDAQAQQIAEVEKQYKDMIEAHPDLIRVEEFLSSRSNGRPPLPDGMPEHGKTFQELLKKREQLANKVPTIPVSRDLNEPRDVRVLARGNWQDDSGKIMQPATPLFLGGPVSTEDQRLNRLDLANWLFVPDHPLTSRTVVNRLWGRYLGSPLSSNTVDLGSQGTAPTHPKLLDYLAVEFRDQGWDLKHMIRLIVTSQTYKQSANMREDLADIDPNNTRLFARQSAVRLQAEAVRDYVLAVSGLLDPRMGGPSVYPYQPEGHWKPLNFPRRKWPTSKGGDLYRRSLYTWAQRTFPHPLMVSFDAPSRELCTGQRMVSSTPLQSLAMLNGPTFVESARVLAAKLIQHDASDDKRIDRLFELALTRQPRESERTALTALLASHREHFGAKPEDAKALASVGQAPAAEGLDPVEVAAWTSVCRVVLNLHETITRN